MGARIRSFDWSGTALGPVQGWSQGLRSALSICLNSSFPIALYWGDDLVLLYNDDWSPIPGEKHPWALGRPAREAWSDIWDVIEPLFRQVMTTGEATRRRDQLLPMRRHGFTEECYFDYTFSPIRGESGEVEGVFNAVLETTTRVVGDRRQRTLRELAAWKAAEAGAAVDACRTAAQILAGNPHDLPFALLYLLDDDGRHARLAGQAGLDGDAPANPPGVDLTDPDAPWPFRRAAEAGEAVEVHDLHDRFGPLPGGAWPESPKRAVVLPMAKPGQAQPAGFVVAGVSPRLRFDEEYKGFMDLLAGHVAALVSNARAYEQERRRAEELAELDRAKTAFFSNVSHEFRTPLTLMLGPVEDILADPGGGMPRESRELLEVVHRNGRRLLRLVNTLLDFSRIEAGRVEACYEPTDLAALTADLASNFSSACERAGLELVVDCPPLGEPVFVDRGMWEKVVLNLLSNAFKFTLEGRIEVHLGTAAGHAELTIRDTGTGVPPEELPRLFERFHRIQGAGGRTQEGSGIGLALVRELARLHGGEVRAASVFGEGSAFTVTIPLGNAHLPAGRIGAPHTLAPTALGVAPYVEEALRWLPEGDDRPAPGPEPPYGGGLDAPVARPGAAAPAAHVLLADDNADMRGYVRRLLADRYEVTAVGDGLAAADAARRRPPDLVISDVMMPGLDGFGLLRELRADPRTREVPVLLLSARAGEEARVEGLGAGADDYITKPFHARELLARVASQLDLARLRRQAERERRRGEERLRLALTAARMVAWEFDPIGDKVVASDNAADVFGLRPGSTIETIEQGLALIHPDDVGRHRATLMRAVEERGSYLSQFRMIRPDDGEVIWLEERGHAARGEPGQAVRVVGVVMDVTARKRAEDELQEERDRLRVTLASIGDAVITTDTEGRVAFLNGEAESLTGWTNADAAGRPLDAVFHIVSEATGQPVESPATRALREGVVVGLANHTVLITKDGAKRPIDDSAAPVRDGEGRVVGCVLVFRDITERRRLEKQAREQAEAAGKLAAIVDSSEDAIVSKTLGGIIQSWNAAAERIFGYAAEEAVGRPITMLFPADRLDEEEKIINRIRSGERVEHFDTIRLRKDGTPIPISLTISPIRDEEGRIVGASKIARDITERKRAEAELRHSQARLAAELEATTRLHDLSTRLLSAVDLRAALDDVLENAIQTCGADFGNIQLFNPQVGALEIVAQRGFRQDFLDYFRTVRVDEGSACAQAMQGGKRIAIEDVELDPSFEPHRGVAAAAGYRAVASTPLMAHDGAVVGMLSTHFRSPHRLSERDGRLLDLYARHAADLVERMRLLDELRQIAADLSEAGRRKDEFLATLSHELRNPLAPIRNGLQIIKIASGDPRAIAESRTLMERQVTLLVRLIDDLMDVSRITRGKLTLRKERVELATVINAAVDTSRPLIEASDHELNLTVPARPIFVDADPTRLAQVFSNLLNNAAKYTEPGGVIALIAERRGSDVVVTVRDNGVGIPPEMLSHVFEMFTQVDRSLERSQGGLGIGLSLVKGMVEMHGGSVEARSEGQGRGSEFVVRLPIVVSPKPQPADGGGAGGVAAPVAGRRILIVDDNQDSARTLARLLKLMGHEARTAHDGGEAVEAAEQYRPELILLDIGLPGMNGYDVARTIRRRPWGDGAVIVALTGWGQEGDRRRSQEAGIDHHLVKPLDPVELEGLLTGLRPGGPG